MSKIDFLIFFSPELLEDFQIKKEGAGTLRTLKVKIKFSSFM